MSTPQQPVHPINNPLPVCPDCGRMIDVQRLVEHAETTLVWSDEQNEERQRWVKEEKEIGWAWYCDECDIDWDGLGSLSMVAERR